MIETIKHPAGQAIKFTEVTLRDGMQQKGIKTTSTIDRLEVAEHLITAGMQRIEIGHLGNEEGGDIEFAAALGERVQAAKNQHDDRFDDVEWQVLFGSHLDKIEPGVAALENLTKDRVIVHVYDRLAKELRQLAAKDYSSQVSAQRIIDAAQIAVERGFTKFSISGEGADNPGTSMEEVIEFYATITDALFERGAEEVNCNFANTYGLAVDRKSYAKLVTFNRDVKRGRNNVTTSVHVHNDNNDAPNYSITALRAGFDRVEGTMFGMGERFGNVAIADVMTRLIEDARHEIEDTETPLTANVIGGIAIMESIWKTRFVDPSVLAALHRFHASCNAIADIFGTHQRFEKTSLGTVAAYDAGSGPHAHAYREFLRDPVKNPVWKTYAYSALTHAVLGRQEAEEIISVDPDRIKQVTIPTHAAGGSTNQVLNNKVEVASPEAWKASEALAQQKMDAIASMLGGNAIND